MLLEGLIVECELLRSEVRRESPVRTLDRRLQVLDDVAQVMNRAVEGVIGKGHRAAMIIGALGEAD